MGRPTTQSVTGGRSDFSQAPLSFPSRLFRAAFQFGVAWVILIAIWQLLGPEPETKSEHRLRIALIGLTCSLTVGLWLVTSQWRVIAKIATISACLIVTLTFAINSVREFDASCRVLEPAQLSHGRIVHDAIGLSYATLPNLKVQLQPVIKRNPSLPAKSGTKPPTRLGLGDVAAFRHILPVSQVGTSNRSPTMIVLEIQNNPLYDRGQLIRFVRTNEAKMAASTDVQIVQKTHHVQIAGLDMVEYELINIPRNMMARTVYLRAGMFLLNFMLLTDNEADRDQFDELLKSIRLEGPALVTGSG